MMFLRMFAGSAGGGRGQLTVGTSGGTFGGPGSGGSVNNSNVVLPTATDAEITSLYSAPGTIDLLLGLIQTGGDPGQTAFSRVLIESGSGTMREFDTSAATFTWFPGPAVAQWIWGVGSNPVYQSGDEGEVHPYAILL